MDLFLSSVTPLLKKGAKEEIKQDDLGYLEASIQANGLYQHVFARLWNHECSLSPEKRSLWKVLVRSVGYFDLISGLVLALIAGACTFGPPLLLKALSEHFSKTAERTTTELWVFVLLLLLCPMIGSVCQARSFIIYTRAAAIARNSLIPAIYRKVLTLGSSSRNEFSTGQVMNLFSVDIRAIQLFVSYFSSELFGPIQLAVALLLLYQEMGLAMFAGLGFVVFILPILIVCFILYASTKRKKCVVGDNRIKMTNEIMSGIRIIKYYAWECPFERIIEEIRGCEMKLLLRMNIIMVVIIMLITSVPYIMPTVMFYTFSKLGNNLNVTRAFTTIALIGLVTGPITAIPSFLQRLLASKVSMERILKFLLCDEIEAYIMCSEQICDGNDMPLIHFRNASLSWSKNIQLQSCPNTNQLIPFKKSELTYSKVETRTFELSTVKNERSEVLLSNCVVNALKTLNISINRGDLVAVIGPVGSGKTSFLSALLGEMFPSSAQGEVHRNSNDIAYHNQQPWILNDTLLENIIFGKEYDEKRFAVAVEASCLGPDIEMLPAGIMTEIGEKGINLSGGQKARVSFARTVYRDADIYLLDDPLSAVDAHVGAHLFEKGILGALAGKTVVLVTHQVQFLRSCHKIIVLRDGEIAAQGSFEDIQQAGIDIAKIAEVEAKGDDSNSPNLSVVVTEEEVDIDFDTSHASDNTDNIDASFDNKCTKGSDNATHVGNLMSTEEKEVGSVSKDVYLWYARLGGVQWFAFAFAIMVLCQGSYTYAGFVLAEWGKATEDSYEDNDEPLSKRKNLEYVNLYALFASMGIVGTVCRTSLLVAFGYHASRNGHHKLLNKLLSVPVSFYDVTPIGRILNRFTSDITQTDETLPTNMSLALGLLFNILGNVVAISYTTQGILLLAIVPIAYLYYRVHVFFCATNTELKRLENVTRSPIYTEFDQTLQGVSSIRAFREEQHFISKMETSVDRNTNVLMVQQHVKWWMLIRLETMGGLISALIGALAVAFPGFLSSEYISLALANSFLIVGHMKFLVNISAEMEAAMSSIERVRHYSENLVSEETEDMRAAYKSVPADWPADGRIEATDLQMKYSNGPLVLKGLNFNITPNEKVGVVGRTGCGKSSLIVSLFRIEELCSGRVEVDGMDISTVPLSILRSRFGIIPQDPMIFSIDVRFNLDPFHTHSDEELWEVLESVSMKGVISSLPRQLAEPVAEGGDNFSVGQKQLLCIARALLRKPKVLVLDEATASVDNDTDSLIQRMVREKFKHSTVLTIAHRLHTVFDSDRIMLLDKGALIEFDSADNLLKIKNGAFSDMWKKHVESHKD